jgi:hypothetical protein
MVSGHQLLYAAAFAGLPLPAGLLQTLGNRSQQAPAATSPRWTADGWILLRRESVGSVLGNGLAPGYGASQTGAVLRYRLAPLSRHQPMLHLRASVAINPPRERELGFGASIRPLGRVPLRAAVELRAAQSGGQTRLRPAAFVVTDLTPQDLPRGFRVEAYAQSGYVGGANASAFVDGQLRIDRQLARIGPAELRGGGGAWGGAQIGAGRLDVGPGLSLGMRVGDASARLSADWRFRVAGTARPGSGPAVTLSAGF